MIHYIKKLLFTVIFLFSFLTQGQNIEIKGIVLNDTTKKAIEFATVQIESTKNSRLLGYGFSNEKGEFSLEANIVNETEISMVITYIGFTTYKKSITLNDHHLNIGEILLHESIENLNEIVITATPPVLIKKDTIQYNASSFKTKEDAVAEDLFKKLPGVSVDSDDGTIRVNGVDVTKILVNGEPFFGKNPKIAMKILSKDLIHKIEITDTKTEEENFTGSVNSEEAKTINIILKKKKNGNVFGNITTGYGTNKRNETNGVVNRVYKKSLFTLLAFSNNINKNNFSYDDKNESNTIDKSRAIKTQTNIGANYSDKFKNGDKINANYTFSNTENNRSVRNDQIILLPSRNNFRLDNSDQDLEQISHRGNIKLINSVFENFRLVTNTNFLFRDIDLFKDNDGETKNEENNLINKSNDQQLQNQKKQSINSSLNAIYKLPKLNSFLVYKIFTTSNSSILNRNNKSKTEFFTNNARIISIDQFTKQNKYDTRIGNSFKYGQKIGSRHVLEYQIENRKEKQKTNQAVLDLSNNGELDNKLSFNQNVDIKTLEHKFSYTYKKKNSTYNLKISHLNTKLSNQEFNRNIGVSKKFNDFLFFVKARHKTKKGTIFNANYRTKSIIPKYNELLAITDNTNRRRINIGNPNLNRELEHFFSFNVRYFNRKNQIYFFNRLSYNTVQDKIINKSTIDDESVITKTFTNNSNNNRFTVNGSVSKNYKNTSLFYNLKLRWYVSKGKNAHFVNNNSFKSNFKNISPSLHAEFNYNDLFEISPFYKLLLEDTKYDSDEIRDQSNTQHTFGLNITTFAPKKFTVFNQIRYNLNPQFDKNFGREALVWNITLNYNIIPKKAKLKLTVFNILNQYNNTSRFIDEYKISVNTYDVLRQYAMLSFKYIFKN